MLKIGDKVSWFHYLNKVEDLCVGSYNRILLKNNGLVHIHKVRKLVKDNKLNQKLYPNNTVKDGYIHIKIKGVDSEG